MSDKKKTSDKVPTEISGSPAPDNRRYIKQETWVTIEAGTILSFMPGTVGDIKVKKGDKVHKGDLLMIYRAMKMNNRILSPIDGTVQSIEVTTGTNLPKNTVMIEIR